MHLWHEVHGDQTVGYCVSPNIQLLDCDSVEDTAGACA
jgi:hypothetical protein